MSIYNDFRLSYEPEKIPFVIQMIHSGEDADSIIRSVLRDDAQVSIDVIDQACSTHALRRDIRELKPILICSIG